MPKAVSPLDPAARQSRRHNPLHQELIESGGGSGGNLRKVARTKRTKERQERSTADYVDPGLSKRILQIAKEQQDEIALETEAATRDVTGFLGAAGQMRFDDDDDDEDSDEGENDGFGYEEEEVEEVEVDEGDEELFNRFMSADLPQPQQQQQRVSLADKILEKIAEHEAKLASGHGGEMGDDSTPALPPKVVEVYTKYVFVLPPPSGTAALLTLRDGGGVDWQGGDTVVAVQVRQAAQGLQDHPVAAQLGADSVHHPAGQVDGQRLLRDHQALCLAEVGPDTKVRLPFVLGLRGKIGVVLARGDIDGDGDDAGSCR